LGLFSLRPGTAELVLKQWLESKICDQDTPEHKPLTTFSR